MGLLRTIVKSFAGLLFSLSLILTISLLLLTQFTGYDYLKSIFSDILVKQFANTLADRLPTSEDVRTIQTSFLSYCNMTGHVEIPFSGQEMEFAGQRLNLQNITLNCSEIATTTPDDFIKIVSARFINQVSSKLFDSFYYKNYTCNFIDCIKQGGESLMAIASNKSNTFFKTTLSYSLIGTFIFGLIWFIAIESWPSRFKSFGWTLIIISAPFFLMNYVTDLILPKLGIPTEIISTVSNSFSRLTSTMTTYNLIFLVVGIILMVAGYFLALKKKKKS